MAGHRHSTSASECATTTKTIVCQDTTTTGLAKAKAHANKGTGRAHAGKAVTRAQLKKTPKAWLRWKPMCIGKLMGRPWSTGMMLMQRL